MARKMRPARVLSKSPRAARERRALFVEAYLANGRRVQEAAITAGYAKGSATQSGASAMKHPDVIAALDARMAEELAKAQIITGVSIQRTLLEIGRLCYTDPRKMFGPDGKLKAIAELDDDCAAALASVEYEQKPRSNTTVTKVKLWDKNAALEKAMKHLGLYKADNEQAAEALAGLVVYVPEKNARGSGKAG